MIGEPDKWFVVMSSVIGFLVVLLGAFVAFLNSLLWKKLDRMTLLFVQQINDMNDKHIHVVERIAKIEGNGK